VARYRLHLEQLLAALDRAAPGEAP
jgi:hypothetical protein